MLKDYGSVQKNFTLFTNSLRIITIKNFSIRPCKARVPKMQTILPLHSHPPPHLFSKCNHHERASWQLSAQGTISKSAQKSLPHVSANHWPGNSVALQKNILQSTTIYYAWNSPSIGSPKNSLSWIEISEWLNKELKR